MKCKQKHSDEPVIDASIAIPANNPMSYWLGIVDRNSYTFNP